jgi:FkbM family methyltransferase
MPWELPIAVLLMELASRADPKSLVIEIGANIGTLTVPLALNFSGRVVAFEPVESTFADLKKNLALNKIDNVRALMKACSATPGSGEMIGIVERNRGLAQLDISQSGKTVVTTIDNEAARIGSSVSLIKIDVEGHEGAVLDGAQNVIRKDKPLIVCELFGENRQAILEKMKAYGFQARRLFRSDWIFYPSSL